MLHYQLQIIDLSAHIMRVYLTFTPTAAQHQLALAGWIPGSYLVRNFARHITAISAKDADGALELLQLDKQRWQVNCRQTAVTLQYDVYANDQSVRAAYVDDEIAILNPACLCLAVEGFTEQPVTLTLAQPVSRVTQNWQVATALPRAEGTALLSFGKYQARDYAHLIDCPLLVGIFTLEQFNLDGIPHYLVVSGTPLQDRARLLADTEKICQSQRRVFGGLPEDLEHYWFLLWVTENGYGGLEHMDSTLLMCSRYDLPAQGLTEPDDAYQTLLGLISHEYFHTWWVKRLKPACFHPYQLQQEQYTRQLWIYEGFTSYFDDLALLKSGVISQQAYLTLLEQMITRVTRNPSDRRQSLADSSFNAWTKYYLQDENAVNSVVSYYAKGALVALCLEAQLQRRGTDLSTFCRQFYLEYLATGSAENSIFIFIQQQGWPELAAQLHAWVEQAEPLPLTEHLAMLGLSLTWRSPISFDDLGGNKTVPLSASLGCSLKQQGQELLVQNLYLDSAAHQAGLMSGDQLVALAGFKITAKSLPQLLQRLPLNSVQDLLIFRKDRLLTLQLPLLPAAKTVAMLQVAEGSQLQSWLG